MGTLIIHNNTLSWLPEQANLELCLQKALLPAHQKALVTLNLLSSQEIQALNARYRGKDKPTNVLSFVSPVPEAFREDEHLGDILACAEIIESEAKSQGKTLESHWIHMIVHSVLHLQGFDHENETDAQQMESMEINILKELGFDDPYREDRHE
jgi:probable rRNA maturation factor